MKILYVYRHHRTFVKRDLELLSKHFEVKPFFFTLRKIFSLLIHIYRSDLVFIWFASYHAFVTTLFTRLVRRPVIVVTGGYDVAGEKEIKYGLMLNRMTLKRMVNFVLKHADKILAVSEFNKKEIEKYLGITKAEVIYNSVDSEKFYPEGKKQDIVLTVGFISWENIKRKGFETFVKAAKYLPEVQFVLIGNASDDSINHLQSIASSNVKFTGYVSDEKLLAYYQSAKVYCQLSYYESYGMAPAEAMLCQCVPVVVNRGALPEVVGDTGFYAPYGDEKETAEAIKKALQSKSGKKARERIIKLFPSELREKKLREIVKDMK